MRFFVAMMLACLMVVGCDGNDEQAKTQQLQAEAIRELTSEVKKLRQEAQRQRGVPVPNTIEVPGDLPTIAAAISAAADGDVINIAAGTYNEGNLDPGGKAITIQGTLNADGSLATTIDAQQQARVFRFASSETSLTVVQNLVITGGNADASNSFDGGGIYCRNNSNPTIRGCTITDNTANDYSWGGQDGRGGGISCIESNPTISDCTITGNTAGVGSGIYCIESNPIIRGCKITGNTANQIGGGIYCWGSSNPTISGCTIKGNTAEHKGGGIYFHKNTSITITDCTIENNTAMRGGGGGIYFDKDTSITITDCTIENNTAKLNGDGGGIYLAGSNPTITGCTIEGNTAQSGGGIYSAGSNLTITGSTIEGNTASSGREVYHNWNSNCTISDCTIGDSFIKSLSF